MSSDTIIPLELPLALALGIERNIRGSENLLEHPHRENRWNRVDGSAIDGDDPPLWRKLAVPVDCLAQPSLDCLTVASDGSQDGGVASMDVGLRIEHDLEAAVARTATSECPPRLAEAIRYAVFPGGARIRPRLCLAVAKACGDSNPMAATTAATVIELLHCASLVHDDLPCFDGADVRRGKPSVHRAFGEPLTLLVGDALIVLAFETLALRLAPVPDRLVALTRIVSSSIGAPGGIIAGQAWECEARMDIVQYRRAKTGSLFAACAMAGAAASGEDPAAWRVMGLAVGEAFQVADDIRDVAGEAEKIGKPTGQDAANGRPNAVAELGLDGAKRHFESLLDAAIAAIPDCPGAEQLHTQIVAVSRSLVTGLGARRAA